jgi:hypothetical protein
MEILKTKDDFLWGNVTNKAKEIFNSGLFELYFVGFDDVDYLINDFDTLNTHLENGQNIYIELNHLNDI